MKDFGEKGELKYDHRIMSNADASSILFDQNDPTKINPPLKRSLPIDLVRWQRKIGLKHQFKVVNHYEVSGNVYDLNNWK